MLESQLKGGLNVRQKSCSFGAVLHSFAACSCSNCAVAFLSDYMIKMHFNTTARQKTPQQRNLIFYIIGSFGSITFAYWMCVSLSNAFLRRGPYVAHDSDTPGENPSQNNGSIV
jgi:hypothetical protein